MRVLGWLATALGVIGVGTKVRDLVSSFIEGPYASLHQDVAGLRERLTSISDVVRRLAGGPDPGRR